MGAGKWLSVLGSVVGMDPPTHHPACRRHSLVVGGRRLAGVGAADPRAVWSMGVAAWPRWAGRRRRARWPPLLPCRWDVGVSLTRSVSHRITRQWQRRRGTASCPLRTPTGSRNGLAIRGRSLTNEWLPASSTHAAYVRIYVCVRISSWSSYSSCAPAPINVHTSGRVKHGAQQDSVLCCRPLMRGEMDSLLLSVVTLSVTGNGLVRKFCGELSSRWEWPTSGARHHVSFLNFERSQ